VRARGKVVRAIDTPRLTAASVGVSRKMGDVLNHAGAQGEPRLLANLYAAAAVEAAAATGVPLRIAGQGPERDALERRARELRAPVTFLGRIPRDRVASLLAGAGAVLLPSNYHEFSPYAVLEAMAAGVPVLGSAVGGVPELVGAERVLPRGDTGALSERLRELWAEPERRRQEGDALIARVRRNHSEELFLERLLSLYRAG